jgi:drug/metabolite transporter (DMT)-like permease
MTVFVFLLVLLAAFLHATWNFAAKKVSGDMAVLWLSLCVASVISWPFAFARWDAQAMTGDALVAVLATGAIHAIYFRLLAQAYRTGDISSVYPVARGTGVGGTALVAYLWRLEPLSMAGGLGILTICVGTLLIGLDQRSQRGAMIAYGFALLVGLTIIAYSVIDKLAVAAIEPVVYISGMFTLCTLLLAPFQGPMHTYRRALRESKRFIVLIGVGSIVTYLMILFAFRLGPVSYIVAVREFAVVIGACFGVLCLNERLTPPKIVGMGAILCGLVLVKLA